MFPIRDHTKYKFGYLHGQPTFYSDFHLGYDLLCDSQELFMAFDGEVIYKPGPQSGECIWVRFDAQPGLTHRFMHLKKGTIKTGRRKEGERIAITGNTGVSTRPHVHHDTYKGQNPNPNDRKNFIDPLTLDWNPKPPPIELRVKVVASDAPWPIEVYLDMCADWYRSNTDGRITLSFDLERADLRPIKWTDGHVDDDWYAQHVLPKAVGFDAVILIVDEWRGTDGHWGWARGDSPQKTMKIEFFAPQWAGEFNMWMAAHELSHVIFYLTVGEPRDLTHTYFKDVAYNRENSHKIFQFIEYETLRTALERRRKEQFVPQIKTQGKGASRRIVLEAADLTEWKSLCKVFGKSAADKDLEEKVN